MDNIFILILATVLIFALGFAIGLPSLPHDEITNHCQSLGYNTALKQYGTYYCANELIIEDTYTVKENK